MVFQVRQHVAEPRRSDVLRFQGNRPIEHGPPPKQRDVGSGLTSRLGDLFGARHGALLAADGPVSDPPGKGVACEEMEDGPPHRLEKERQDGGHSQQERAEHDLVDPIQIVEPGIEQRRTDQESQNTNAGERGHQRREPVRNEPLRIEAIGRVSQR